MIDARAEVRRRKRREWVLCAVMVGLFVLAVTPEVAYFSDAARHRGQDHRVYVALELARDGSGGCCTVVRRQEMEHDAVVGAGGWTEWSSLDVAADIQVRPAVSRVPLVRLPYSSGWIVSVQVAFEWNDPSCMSNDRECLEPIFLRAMGETPEIHASGLEEARARLSSYGARFVVREEIWWRVLAALLPWAFAIGMFSISPMMWKQYRVRRAWQAVARGGKVCPACRY
ncbi:MAG: hypothetical protein EA380_08810, partial [Phycisphaeraceae bacterium]